MLFGNYSLSLSKLSSKNSGKYSKKYTKNKCVSFNEGENEKIYHIYTAWMELGLDMVTNILNIKYNMYNDSYIH